MKEKLVSIAVFTALAYLLPLAGRPDLIATPHMAIILLATIVIFATQPPIRLTDVAVDQRRDKNSVLFILLGFLAAQAAGVVEWAYAGAAHAWALDGWTVAGLAVLAGGTWLRVWSIRLLGRYFTATVKTQDDQQVIRHGPYALVRHPSYLGALLASLGSALLLHAPAAFLFALAILLAAYWYRIRVEETALVGQLGEAYVRYQQETKRLIPFLY